MRPGLSTGDDPFSAGQGRAQSLTGDVPSNLSHVAPAQPAEGLSGLGEQLDRQPSPSSSRQRSRIVYPYPLVILALLDISYAVSAAREGQHIPAPLVTFTVARASVLIGIVGCSRRWRFRGGWVGMVCATSIGAAVWEACRGVLMRRVIPPEQGHNAVKGSFLAITSAIALLEYLLFLLLVRLSPPVRQAGGTSLRLPTSRDARLFSSASTRGRHSGAGSLSSPARSRRKGQCGSALSTPARTRPSRQQRRASAVSWLAEQAVHNTQAGAGADRLLSPGPVGPSLDDPYQAYHGVQPGTPRHGDQTPATATTFSPRWIEQSGTGTSDSTRARVSSDPAGETGIALRNDETGSPDDEDQSTEFGSSDQSDDPDDSEDKDDDADSASSVSESSIIDLPPPLQPSRIVPPSLSMNGGLSSLADRSPILRPLVRRTRSARFLGRSWGSPGGGGDGSDDGDVEARAEGYGTFRQR